MKVLELFAGQRCIGKAFERRGHQVFSVDYDKQHSDIDWYADVGSITAEDIINRFGRPDVIWASPDCTSYSIAAISHHRTREAIRKYNELTNEPLAGASFRLWKTEGETWSETQITGADGTIVWTDLDPGIYSVQEIDEPYGFFKDPARKEILLEGGDNKQLEFFNRPRPVLTILKRDQITGEPLEGVKFKVQKIQRLSINQRRFGSRQSALIYTVLRLKD